VGKPERRKRLERAKHRWEDITMDMQDMGQESMDWTDMAQDRDRWQALVDAVTNLQVP